MLKASLLIALVAGSPAALAQTTVSFEFVPGVATANDMSPDGRFIVGELDRNGDFFPDGTYLWDRQTGQFTELPAEGLAAVAVSDDGTVVLGEIPDPNNPDPQLGVTAAIWTAQTGWQSLGFLPGALNCPSKSTSYELSADGSIAVGLSWVGCDARGFIWTAQTGMQELERLANGTNRATICSADGSVIVGFAQGSFSRTPAVWDGVTRTGTTSDPNADLLGEWHGIRDDGSVFVGTALLDDPLGSFVAIKQVTGGPIEQIASGSLLPGWEGHAFDIADDGTIVGFDLLWPMRRAWIQPRGVGPLHLLSDWATARGAVLGTTLDVAQAISSDGTVIIGHGFGTGAWVLTITPPACLADLTGSTNPNDPAFGVPDGILDANDFFFYLGLFGAGDLAADLTGSIDPNDPGFGVPDGTLDANDFFFYLDLFAQGCP